MKRDFEKAFQLLVRMSAEADMQVYGKKGKQGFIMLKAEEIYKILLTTYGKPRWWFEDPFTVMFQSVLVQNTAWRSVEKPVHLLGIN